MSTLINRISRSRTQNYFILIMGSLVGLIFLLYIGCAQVPMESVELSTTVGRDLAEVHRAHRELAVILFDGMKGDINRFVDEVYAPFQIRKLLESDYADFEAGDPNSLFSSMELARTQPDNTATQTAVLETMEIFVQILRQEVERYRQQRLAPVLAQEAEVLQEIDQAYTRIHQANSIVTAHLASLVEVHDAQEDLLRQVGLEGLRQRIGEDLVNTSRELSGFTQAATRIDDSLADTDGNIQELTRQLDEILNK